MKAEAVMVLVTTCWPGLGVSALGVAKACETELDGLFAEQAASNQLPATAMDPASTLRRVAFIVIPPRTAPRTRRGAWRPHHP